MVIRGLYLAIEDRMSLSLEEKPLELIDRIDRLSEAVRLIRGGGGERESIDDVDETDGKN